MAAFLREHAGWVGAVFLPVYAPELNPAEGVWSQLGRTAVVT